MNCIIPGANLKILNKVCQTLSKIGDYLYIEARTDSLQISTVNVSKTAFSKFTFHSSFFTNLTLKSQSTEDTVVSCKIHMKSNVFKSKGPKDKKIEYCKLELDEESSILIITIMYSVDLTVRHEINLVEKEQINLDYDLEKLPNKINFSKMVLQRILNNFQSRDEDMSIEFKNDKCIIRNYDLNNEITHDLRSQIFLKPDDFNEYKIGNETTTITIGFKSFRAAANFCENFNLNGILNFDCGGKPVILSIKDPTFEANFILSSVGFPSETSSIGTQPEIRQLKSIDVVDDDDNNVNNEIIEDNINLMSSMVLNQFEMDVDNEENFPEGNSPESPRTKRIKLVFGRCFQDEFDDHKDLGRKLVSDTDTD